MTGYYYCSLETFLNILKSKQLYLSDPLKTNIYPMLYSDDLIESVIARMTMRSKLDISSNDIINTLLAKGQSSVYVSGFSKSFDAFNLWEKYGDDGNGVAIEFDLDKLAIKDNFHIREVIYSENTVENDIEVVAHQIDTVIKEHTISDKMLKTEVFLRELISELAKYKDPSFKAENEIHLIYCDDLKFDETEVSYGASKIEQLEHDYRTIRNKNIIEFVKLNFVSDAIKSICIGPKCQLKENDILSISKRYLGTKPNVTVSEADYR